MTVYILEAHFVENDLEGWPIGTLYRYPQHKTLEDRMTMATKFMTEFNYAVPMYVDTMLDSFNNKFNIWPDKCIIVQPAGPRQVKIVFTALLDSDASRGVDQWALQVTNFLDQMND